jgi:hypothetical protein
VTALYISLKAELAEYTLTNTTKLDDIKENVKTQVHSSLIWALTNQNKFQYIQQFQTSPYIAQVKKYIIKKYSEPHLTLIKKGIEKGIIKNSPVELVYSLMSSQVFGLYQFIISNKLSKLKQQEIIHTTFEMLWDMIT